MAENDLVLLTGVSGFIARHTALALLHAGYRIRGTIRSRRRGEETLAALAANGADASRVELIEADLLNDDGWDRAAAGCRYVLHMASPFPRRIPRDKFGLVAPAKDGTLRVLAAADRAGAERVVLTSSVAAVYYGHETRADQRFTEADFSNVDSATIGSYAASKTLAERAAWAFANGKTFELVAINPSVVLGPLIGKEIGTSVGVIRSMMRGRMPFVPNVALGVVDARDVALAHLKAMTVPNAAGRRFIVSAGSLTLMEMAKAVATAVPSVRWRLPKMILPDTGVRMAALFLPEARQVAAELGQRKELVARAAQNILGVSFVPPREAVAATARGLVSHRLV